MKAGRFLTLVVFLSLGGFAFADEKHSGEGDGSGRPAATSEEQVKTLQEKINACMVGRGGVSDSTARSALSAGVGGGRSSSSY
jgi:hypothetical protein